MSSWWAPLTYHDIYVPIVSIHDTIILLTISSSWHICGNSVYLWHHYFTVPSLHEIYVPIVYIHDTIILLTISSRHICVNSVYLWYHYFTVSSLHDVYAVVSFHDIHADNLSLWYTPLTAHNGMPVRYAPPTLPYELPNMIRVWLMHTSQKQVISRWIPTRDSVRSWQH